MRVLCRLSWEEESHVSTGHDNSPWSNTIWFYIYIYLYLLAVNFFESFNELYIRDFMYSSWSDFCDWSNLLFLLGITRVLLRLFEGWFPPSRYYFVQTHVKFTRVNEIDAMYGRSRVSDDYTLKLNLAQLLGLRVTFYTLSLFYLSVCT